jgi:L-lysine exporter family protein LysE/ArgO
VAAPSAPAAQGFLLGVSLILAIGAQNAFVLRQGLLRRHVLAVCLVCALSDAVLIAAGIAGFGALVERLPGLPRAMAWFGAAFLFWYGATTRFRAAPPRPPAASEGGRGGAVLPRRDCNATCFRYAVTCLISGRESLCHRLHLFIYFCNSSLLFHWA